MWEMKLCIKYRRTVNIRKGKWIGDILGKNCLLKHEEKVEGTGRRGRRRKRLLGDIKETRRYWKLEEQALHITLWRISFGRGSGLVVRQTA